MKKFTYFWLTGDRQVLKGNDPTDALNKAGYSQGALKALDFWANDDNNDYIWDAETQSWDLTPEGIKRLFE